MTINREPDGSVSFRVIIGAGAGRAGECHLVELIISPEHIGDLNHVLAGHGAEVMGGNAQVPPFACHIGFCRNAINAVNTAA
jgi:hypothetical protein